MRLSWNQISIRIEIVWMLAWDHAGQNSLQTFNCTYTTSWTCEACVWRILFISSNTFSYWSHVKCKHLLSTILLQLKKCAVLTSCQSHINIQIIEICYYMWITIGTEEPACNKMRHHNAGLVYIYSISVYIYIQ